MIVPRNSSSVSQGVLISNERYFLKGRFQSERELEHEKNSGQRLIGRGGRSGPRECASTGEPESDRLSGTCLSGDGQEIPPNGHREVANRDRAERPRQGNKDHQRSPAACEYGRGDAEELEICASERRNHGTAGVQFPSVILLRAKPAPVHAAKRNQVTEV